MSRNLLQDHQLHEDIRAQVLSYHSDIVEQVKQAVENNRVVVVGMRWNDAVAGARKTLQKVGIEFTYLEYGSYLSNWRGRLALKMWSGWPTFPMVFVDQKLVGGNSDLRKLLAAGKVK